MNKDVQDERIWDDISCKQTGIASTSTSIDPVVTYSRRRQDAATDIWKTVLTDSEAYVRVLERKLHQASLQFIGVSREYNFQEDYRDLDESSEDLTESEPGMDTDEGLALLWDRQPDESEPTISIHRKSEIQIMYGSLTRYVLLCCGACTVTDIKELDETESGGQGWSVTISDTALILNDCHEGDSISINGTCLTVTSFDNDSFKVGLAPETLRRTNLGKLNTGDRVNLERAILPHTRLGGHFVQGHIDTTATLISRTPDKNSLVLKLAPKDKSYMKYIIPKGYVALDGASLTVIDVDDVQGWFTVMLIAYTQAHVVLPNRKVGDSINLEVDMLSKYVEKQIQGILRGEDGQLSSYVENLITKASAGK